jgi:hypothetical protein
MWELAVECNSICHICKAYAKLKFNLLPSPAFD